MRKFEILPVVDKKLDPITQAAMYEKTAAKYVMLGIHEFRELVHKGVILFRTRHGHNRRIYLKSDLDNYLSSLPIGAKIQASEDSSDSIY